MKKRWKVNPANKELQGLFSRELNILPLTAQLLVNRGLVDCDRAFSFLRPALDGLHDPYLMKDMDLAVERIVAAVDKGERIALFGDYDVDGTTATALLYLFFKELGVDTITYIPERLTEGYGLNRGALTELAGVGVKVLITADCGVSNTDEVEYARSLGIDCIITDHH
jgi:single-stranded-DNA-specific exonuclease